MAMTKHLEEALKDIKKIIKKGEIFTPEDLYGFPHNRPAWICRRLEEEGKLEDNTVVRRVKGAFTVKYRYRLKQ